MWEGAGKGHFSFLVLIAFHTPRHLLVPAFDHREGDPYGPGEAALPPLQKIFDCFNVEMPYFCGIFTDNCILCNRKAIMHCIGKARQTATFGILEAPLTPHPLNPSMVGCHYKLAIEVSMSEYL